MSTNTVLVGNTIAGKTIKFDILSNYVLAENKT